MMLGYFCLKCQYIGVLGANDDGLSTVHILNMEVQYSPIKPSNTRLPSSPVAGDKVLQLSA